MMHESNNLDHVWSSDVFNMIDIEFQCHDPENNTVSSNAQLVTSLFVGCAIMIVM